MKNTPFTCLLMILALFLGAGCAYMEVTPIGDADRVLTGRVTYNPADAIPSGAILSVRIVDLSDQASGPVLLGQQRVAISGAPPFEFRAEYRADDGLMRRGVNVETKILVNGKLQYGNLTAHVVTLNHATDSQEITVFPTAP